MPAAMHVEMGHDLQHSGTSVDPRYHADHCPALNGSLTLQRQRSIL